MFEGIEFSTIMAILSPIAAVGASYIGMRHKVSTLATTVDKLEKSEPTKAASSDLDKLVESVTKLTSMVSDLDKNKANSADIRSIENKMSGIESQLSGMTARHDDLSRRHSDGITETRSRVLALESRTSTLEQGNAEMRAQLNTLMQSLSRVEAKQDREADAIASLRRELLEVFTGNVHVQKRTRN